MLDVMQGAEPGFRFLSWFSVVISCVLLVHVCSFRCVRFSYFGTELSENDSEMTNFVSCRMWNLNSVSEWLKQLIDILLGD